MIYTLQFFRFVAFFSIFTLHAQCYGWFKYHGTAAMAVSFFFVLSGFLSGLNDADRCAKPSMREWRGYVWKKICKFYPLHFTLLLVSAFYFKGGVFAVFIDGDPHAFLDFAGLFLKNSFLVQSWFDSRYFMFNGVSWFLSTILFLYACTPWLKWGLASVCRGRRWLALAFTVLFFALNFLYCRLVGERGADLVFWAYVFPPSRLPEYAAGLCLGILLSEMVAERKRNPVSFCIMSLLEIGVLWFVVRGVVERWSFGDWGVQSTNYFIQALALIGVFSLQRGIVSRVLMNRLSLVLGILSAPAFLIHQVIINRVSKVYYGPAVDDDQKIVLFFLCLALTLSFSFLVSRKRIMAVFQDVNPATGKRRIVPTAYLAGALGCGILVAGLAFLSPFRKQWESVRIRLSDNQEWDFKNCACIKVYYASPDKPQFNTKRQSVLLNGVPTPGEWYIGFVPVGTTKIRLDFRQTKKSSEKDLRYPKIEEILVGNRKQDSAQLKRLLYKNDVDPMFVLEL